MGAADVTPPVPPSKNVYVNDYASSIFAEHREYFSSVSAEIDDLAGVQIIVLAVQNTGGLAASEYMEQIIRGWDQGGVLGNNAVFLLLDKDRKDIYIGAKGQTANAITQEQWNAILEEASPYFSGSNYSTALLECYKRVAMAVLSYHKVTPGDELLKRLDAGYIKSEAKTSYNMYIFIVLGLLVVLRGFNISRRYQKKYGKSTYNYKRKTFSKQVQEYDESDSDAIIELDDKD
ncbi:TPM domain-containing protein [Ruminococcaceae bacterium OttesenSCG-928-L11]|nr:TPM domain-containing protein [Ruminococcaceae bacterium OttesenSCG-928-L11]